MPAALAQHRARPGARHQLKDVCGRVNGGRLHGVEKYCVLATMDSHAQATKQKPSQTITTNEREEQKEDSYR